MKRDRVLDETVALKVLRPDVAASPEMERRFLAEIRLARAVTHKNVARIHEYGVDGALRYISMAYVDGADLREYLGRHGPLAPHQAYEITIQVADALQAIHDEGIVHRRLIRATLPRPEGEAREPRPIPTFTVHEAANARGGKFRRFRPHGFGQGQGNGNGNANGNFNGNFNGNGMPRFGHGHGGGHGNQASPFGAGRGHGKGGGQNRGGGQHGNRNQQQRRGNKGR